LDRVHERGLEIAWRLYGRFNDLYIGYKALRDGIRGPGIRPFLQDPSRFDGSVQLFHKRIVYIRWIPVAKMGEGAAGMGLEVLDDKVF
jgi:hypothetical protein